MSGSATTTEKRVYTAMAALVFVYLAIRTATVGLANDEAATFFTFVHTGDFVPFVAEYWSANNHFLNSALTWMSFQVFGVSEWAIRLPNLAALILFLFFIFQTGARLQTTYLRWAFWLFILSAHYLLEFFGYTRGYGLSLAFLMGAIYFLLRAGEKQDKSLPLLFWGLLMMALAVLSNLNLLVVFLIWLGLVQILFLQNFRWLQWLAFNIMALVPLGVAVAISLKLKQGQELYLGQPSLMKSIKTIGVRFTGMARTSELGLDIILAVIVVALMLGAALLFRHFRWSKLTRPAGVFFALLGLSLLASQLLFLWMGILFPTERTGLHWYLLLLGCIVFSLDALSVKLKSTLSLLLLFPFLAVVLFSVKVANLHVSSDPLWAREQIPDEFYRDLEAEQKSLAQPLNLSSSNGFYTVTWAFKNLKFGGHLSGCHEFYFENPQYVADYLILNLAEFHAFTPLYDTLRHDNWSGITLLKRKEILNKKRMAKPKEISIPQSSNEWSELATSVVPESCWDEPLRVDYHLNVLSPKAPFMGLVTLELRDSANTVLHYKQFRLDYFKTDFTSSQPITTSLVLDSIPTGTQTARTLLWNIKSEPFALNSSRVDFYQLVEN